MLKTNNLLIVQLFFIFILGSLNGQDFRFSNLSKTTTLSNPSFSGLKQDKINVSSLYKESIYSIVLHQKFALIIDSKILSKGFRDQDWIGAGINYYSDFKGLSTYNNTDWDLNLAYHFSLNPQKKKSIAIGFSVSHTSKRINNAISINSMGFEDLGGFTIPDEPFGILNGANSNPGNGTNSNFGQTPPILQTISLKTKPALSSILNLGIGISYNHFLKNSSLNFGLSLRRVSIPQHDWLRGGYQRQLLEYSDPCPTFEQICRRNNEKVILFNKFSSYASYSINVNKRFKLSATSQLDYSVYYFDSNLNGIIKYKLFSNKDFHLKTGIGIKKAYRSYSQILFGFEFKGLILDIIYDRPLIHVTNQFNDSIEILLGYSITI